MIKMASEKESNTEGERNREKEYDLVIGVN